MVAHEISNRLLVLSLDGLSIPQLKVLASRCPRLAERVDTSTITVVDGRPIASPQAVWAEILTGRRWYELDCPGYAVPTSSLNELEIVSESHLVHAVDLMGGEGSFAQIAINIPLLKPAAGRIWLADGGLPIQTTVHPAELVAGEPFNQYRARPYSSSISASTDQRKSISACLEVELIRLQCALELLKRSDWRVYLLRLSVFDLLAHQIGPDFLSCDGLTVSSEIESFLCSFDRFLNEMMKVHPDFRVCILSAFSHVDCHARLNLNQLLSRAGFCSLVQVSHNDATPEISRRMAAASAAAAAAASAEGAAGESAASETAAMVKVAPARPMVSTGNTFDLEKTVACSPVQGAIYLNRKARFAKGTVDESEVLALVERLANCLQSELTRELGGNFFLWRASGIPANGPELMLYAEGVEIHNSVELPVVDRENHPRATHAANGFVCFPREMTGKGDYVRPIEINSLLKDALK